MMVYRVRWESGIPYIDAGRVVVKGGKKRYKSVEWTRGKTERLSATAAGTIHEAIELAIKSSGFHCSGVFKDKGAGDAAQLVYEVSQLWRLYKRLCKRHLVDAIK